MASVLAASEKLLQVYMTLQIEFFAPGTRLLAGVECDM